MAVDKTLMIRNTTAHMTKSEKLYKAEERPPCTLCPRPAVAQGLCATHYQRQRRGKRGKALAAPERTPAGEGDVVPSIRVPRVLREQILAAAKKEKITEAEWWRRAARERMARQAAERRPSNW